MSTKELYKESLQLHKKNRGKLEVKSKVKLGSKKDLSLVYTPGVAAVCQKINKDKETSFSYSFRGNTVAIISDGSSILGLGNIGPEAGLPVMEGKAILFKELAGVDAFPLCLGTQDVDEIVKTIKYLEPSFVAINLEDIAAPQCFEIEERLKKELSIPVIHDDQHITATVVLAGLINALKLRQSKKDNIKVVVNGAGAAGNAIVKLLVDFGVKDIIACDSKGIIYQGRKGLNKEKKILASMTNKNNVKGKLADALVGADVFIGVSVANILNQEMIKIMAERPIVFALANPIPEIDYQEAKKAGVFIIATGRSDLPNQVNNVLAFPGIFRGIIDNNIKNIDSKLFIEVAKAISQAVDNLNINNILPSPLDKKVLKLIIKAIKKYG